MILPRSKMLIYLFATATGCLFLGFVLGYLSAIDGKPQKPKKIQPPLSAQLIYYSRWRDRQIKKALNDPIN
jgi:hypothetical protein